MPDGNYLDASCRTQFLGMLRQLPRIADDRLRAFRILRLPAMIDREVCPISAKAVTANRPMNPVPPMVSTLIMAQRLV